MKKKTIVHALLIAMLLTVAGCSKNTDPVIPPPTAELGPIKVEKVITRYMDNSVLINDTATYQYDLQGKVTSKNYSFSGAREEYTYSGNQLTSIFTTMKDGSTENINSIPYSANGDTVLLDYTRSNGRPEGKDTALVTYIFQDSSIVGTWTYVHFYQSFTVFTKYRYLYSGNGNLHDYTYVNLTTPSSDSLTVTKWDDKRNPMLGMPRMNYAFVQLGLPLQSSSQNNPLSYNYRSSTFYDYEMTYNGEGYPLTVKNKKESFIGSQIIYNR